MSEEQTQSTPLSVEQVAHHLLQSMVSESGGMHNLSTAQILQTVLGLLMRAERNLHLEASPSDKANGYFQRGLGTPLGQLHISVPRDRDGDFRPHILPEPYVRDTDDRFALLQSLFASRYAPADILRIFDSLGLHYNPQETQQLKDLYLEEFNAWKSRQLPSDAVAILIDAYHAEILQEGKVRKMAAFVVLGVDFQANKDLWGLYICTGNESKEFWLQVFNHLIDRGLKRPILVVSDDFSGLKDAVSALFPHALHQLCLVHMQRNVRRNMGKDHAQAFNLELSKIKLEDHFDHALPRFQALLEQFAKPYPAFVQALQADAENYFAFLKLPKETRKYFYTTNAVESFNSILERIRSRMGGFFQSQDALTINVFIVYKSLRKKKWAHGIPALKANIYALRQLFAQIYGELPHD